MSPFEQLQALYKTRDVKRWHNRPVNETQTVADHSWGVALLVMMMMRQIGRTPSAALLQAALLHDCAEAEIGDIPANTKLRLGRAIKDIEEGCEERLCQGLLTRLTSEEQFYLYWADKLETLMFMLAQVRRGNADMKESVHAQITSLLCHAYCPEPALVFLAELEKLASK